MTDVLKIKFLPEQNHSDILRNITVVEHLIGLVFYSFPIKDSDERQTRYERWKSCKRWLEIKTSGSTVTIESIKNIIDDIRLESVEFVFFNLREPPPNNVEFKKPWVQVQKDWFIQDLSRLNIFDINSAIWSESTSSEIEVSVNVKREEN
jgi:hypothetical protein